jgi:UTP--glucose-1-phosphate uridylyltransferase
MEVRKAVIVAAGLGTRMLPASKAIPKEILPIIDTPAIQFVVEEATRSGIKEIIFVIRPGRTTVLDHFGPAPHLEDHLTTRGRHDLLKRLRSIVPSDIKLTTAEQAKPLGLGHAVLCAREKVGNEPFAVMLPDDIFDSSPPCLAQLMKCAARLKKAVLALLKVAPIETSRYGIVSVNRVGNRLHRILSMVEKPNPADAPSNLAIMGRYILPPEIFELLSKTEPGTAGEIQLTDSLAALAREDEVYGYEFEGTRYDLGDPLGFLMAQVGFGLKRPDLADRFRAYLELLLSS